MSYNEYYSDSDNSEKEDSDNEETPISLNKKPLFKPSIQTSNENDIDDSEVDEAVDGLEEVDDDVQIGGIGDFPDDDDDVEEVNDNVDEDSDVEMNKDDEISPPSKNEESKNNKHNKSQKSPIYNEDEDEDEDDEYDENYLQKFDNEISKNYISEQHPECAIHNYDEISKLSIIVKDNDGIIIDPLHKTLPFLTKYEKTRVLGQRTKQIECGAIPFIKVPEGIIDAHIIADLELQEKKIPFIIRRPIPGGGSEYWNLNDLEIISF